MEAEEGGMRGVSSALDEHVGELVSELQRMYEGVMRREGGGDDETAAAGGIEVSPEGRRGRAQSCSAYMRGQCGVREVMMRRRQRQEGVQR